MDRGYDSIKQLAKEHGAKIPDLLVLAQQNDPFYAGAPASVEAANWFADLWSKSGFVTGVHLRRVHYWLVTGGTARKPNGTPYENTKSDWAYLCSAGRYARYLGLVDPLAFVDRRNPAPHIFISGDDYHSTEPAWSIDDPDWSLPRLDFDSRVDLSLPGPSISGYTYDQSDQPYHLEIWVEKSTMDDELLPIGRKWGANVVTSLGFQSITGVIALLRRIEASGKPARIFYISDFDPAGDGMPVAVARQVEYWLADYAPTADIALTPLVMTREQVIEYKLPRIPVEEKDRRKAHFEEQYGRGAVELDALEALYPGEFERIVAEALAPYRDDDLSDALAEAEQEAQESADDSWSEATGPFVSDLANLEKSVTKIVDRYRGPVDKLRDALAGELAPLQDQMEVLQHAIINARDALAVELPDRPEAELDDPDESGWLFHSDRDYFDQLAVYKARRGKAED